MEPNQLQDKEDPAHRTIGLSADSQHFAHTLQQADKVTLKQQEHPEQGQTHLENIESNQLSPEQINEQLGYEQKERRSEGRSESEDDVFEVEESEEDEEGSNKDQDEEEKIREEGEDDSVIQDSDSNVEDDDSEEQKMEVQEKKEKFIKKEDRIKLRDYQWGLFEQARQRNSIIYLPTGTGKTMVAIAAMYYTLCREGDKKVVFLANTIQLVKQQAEAIKKNLLKIIQDKETAYQLRGGDRSSRLDWSEEMIKNKVCCIHGEKKNEELGKTKRQKIQNQLATRREILAQFQKSSVIVMISQMFLNSLRRGYIRLPSCSMLIFDECHHCTGDHPYAGIMKEFYFDRPKYFDLKGKETKMPIIMGLTASPVEQPTFNKDSLVKQLKGLAEHLDSRYAYYDIQKLRNETDIKVIVAEETEEKELYPDLIAHFQRFRDHFEAYEKVKRHFPTYFPCVEAVINLLVTNEQKLGLQISAYTLNDVDLLLFYDLKECLLIKLRDIWLELGEYAFTLAFWELLNTLYRIKLKDEKNKLILREVVDILRKYAEDYQERYGHCESRFFSAKVNKLIELLKPVAEDGNSFLQMRRPEMVLVFAAKRRTVKYLDELLKQYRGTLTDETEKNCFDSKGVTGYSAKSFSNFSHNEVLYSSDLSSERFLAEAEIKYQEYLEQLNESERANKKQNQGQSEGLRGEINKMRNVKYGKLLLEVEQKYENQIRKINEFKKNKYRVLITTSVTEEGFDIPECNMVISFDQPRSLKSYIQIKGRARKSNSQYLIFTSPEGEAKMNASKKMFEDTICATEQIAINKFAKEEDQEGRKTQHRIFKSGDDYYEKIIVKETGAIINTSYSLEILKIYCASLRQPNKPKFIFIETPNIAFRCLIYFPPNAMTTKSYIVGNPQANKKNALRSAAFEAVRYLYKGGYIRKDLRPKKYEQLQDERQIQRFEDIGQTKKNEAYRAIFEKDTRVRIDKEAGSERKFIRFYYRSISNYQLDFDKINPAFKNHLPLFEQVKFSFQIYHVSFINKIGMRDLDKENNTTQIGILTCFHQKAVPEVFTNYFYSFEENPAEGFTFPLAASSLMLSKEQYLKLQRIHNFILATTQSRELDHYRELSKMKPEKKGWIRPIERQQEQWTRDNSREYYPLLVLIKRKGTEYVLDQAVNKSIETHEKLFVELYQYHNVRIKLESHIKFPRSLNELNEAIRNLRQQKDCQNTLVQSLSSENFPQKWLISERVEYTKQLQTKKSNLEKRYRDMKKTFNYPGQKITDVVKVLHWKRICKEKTTQLFKRDTNILNKGSDHENYFLLEEFCPHPLTPSTLFKATLAVKFAFKALFEYSLALSFKNIALPIIFLKKQQKANKAQQFRLQLNPNIVIEHAEEIYKHLEEVAGSEHLRAMGRMFRERNKQQSTFVKQNISFSMNLDESVIQTKKNNSIDESSIDLSMINGQNMTVNESAWQKPNPETEMTLSEDIKVTEMLKVMTSRMYKFSKYENYQEYEFIGDVVLKMLATYEVFLLKPKADESELHICRANIICNANLHRKSILKGFYKYILAKKYNEMPPPFKSGMKVNTQEIQFYQDTNIQMYDSACQTQGFQYIPGKVHADVVEALIGAFYLNSRNLEECQKLLYALDVLKKPNLRVNFIKINHSQVVNLPKVYEDFEKRINYSFKQKGFLIQAFTHSSFQSVLHAVFDQTHIRDTLPSSKLNLSSSMSFMSVSARSLNDETTIRFSPSQVFYERLEFLGDSILDLVVVQYLYEKYGTKDQGSLTLLKQAGVSNRSLGMIALEYGMHEIILMDHSDNDKVMKDFRRIQSDFEYYFKKPSALIESKIESIKLLGDVFEAFTGALFLDLRMDYKKTKEIILPLMIKFLDHYTEMQESGKGSGEQFQDYLRKNNYQNCQIKKDFTAEIEDGMFRYVLYDRKGTVIDECREVNEKRAWDLITQKIISSRQLSQDAK